MLNANVNENVKAGVLIGVSYLMGALLAWVLRGIVPFDWSLTLHFSFESLALQGGDAVNCPTAL